MLDDVKSILSNLSILVALTLGEPLLLYLTTTTQMVSAVLVVERPKEEHKLTVQRRVYFISEVLSDYKIWYLQALKMLYGVVIARRKLVRYFGAHPVMIVTHYHLSEIVWSHDTTGKVVKWDLEVMGHEITYASYSAIKSPVLADFVAEWTNPRHQQTRSIGSCPSMTR